MTHEERRRGAKAWKLRGGGAKLIEPVVYFDGDGKRAVCGVGVEVGRLMIGFEARAWPGSPAFRAIEWLNRRVDPWWTCPDCGCGNFSYEWCCYRCGAGHPDGA